VVSVVVSRQTIVHFYGNGNANLQLRTGFFVYKGIIPAVKREECISDRMFYVTLRGRWCDTVLNVHAPTEDESDYTNIAFTRN